MTDQKFDLTLKRPKEYSLKIGKRAGLGKGLGLKLDYGNDYSQLFIDDIVEGAVAELNKKYEDREVRILDSIIEVNGIKGSAKQMLAEISESAFVDLIIHRLHSKAQVLKHLSEAKAEGGSPLSGTWILSKTTGKKPE